MENSFTQRYTFKTLMLLSLIAGLVFLYTDHIDFASAAIEYGKASVPNIAYILLRIVGGIFIPVAFVIPSLFEYGRIRLARIGFIFYGALHLLTISWLVYFFASQPAADIFSVDKVSAFLRNGGFVYSYAFWDNYSIASIFFSLLYGIAAIYTGINFDKEKENVKTLVCILLALRIVLPILFNIFFQGRVFSLFWMANNAAALVSQILFAMGILSAGSNDLSWVEFVWDDIVFPENEDQDDPSQNEDENN